MKLIVMPLDDFDLILGMEFFVAAMIQVMSYRKCIIIWAWRCRMLYYTNFRFMADQNHHFNLQNNLRKG